MRRPRAPKHPVGEPTRTAPKRPGSRGRNPESEAVLGARIRAARIVAKMSQSVLGEAVGVSFQQVQKYELGRDRVAASTLQRLAAALGVHPGSFFDDDKPVPVGSAADIRTAMQIAEAVQRVRNPAVLKRLMALVEVVAEVEGDGGDVEAEARSG